MVAVDGARIVDPIYVRGIFKSAPDAAVTSVNHPINEQLAHGERRGEKA
jgi:hypothetical protein